MADEVSAEEHAVTDVVFVEVAHKFGFGEGGCFLESDLETEPATVGAALRAIPIKTGDMR